ncbi:MAG TPA: NUDIX domain-containing protein [Chromatiaceae bacterium]|nr:NUDIX domain-containing protein [Chromatiaceae bacterium]
MILSAGVVIIREEQGTPLFLLLRAYRYWDFPKGKVGPGEDPFDAALREVREETGITELSFPWGRVYRETEAYRSGSGYKIARYYTRRPWVFGFSRLLLVPLD